MTLRIFKDRISSLISEFYLLHNRTHRVLTEITDRHVILSMRKLSEPENFNWRHQYLDLHKKFGQFLIYFC